MPIDYSNYIFGISYAEAREAILFYQRFKETPTFIETVKQIKREHLESELARLQMELDAIL